MRFEPSDEMRCPGCGWPAGEPTGESSSHRSGYGTLRYLRCVCGRWLVLLDGELLAAAGSSALA